MQQLDNRRLAAWRVAQLSRRDRSWLLRRLAPELRAVLDEHLAELKRLKLDSNSLDFEEIMAVVEQRGVNHGAASVRDCFTEGDGDVFRELNDMVRRRPPSQLAAVFNPFPAWFLSLLMRDVPVIQFCYVDHCDDERRELIAQLSPTVRKAVPPALSREVVMMAIEALRRSG